jgi:RNA polymerase sigma-70 factor (ECF subfamily)
MPELTSATLLERLRDRDNAAAWQRFVALYTPLIRLWLGRHLQPADVEDLTQEVLTVLVAKVPAFEHAGRPGSFRAWLRAVCVNCLRAFWRNRPPATDTDALLRQLEDPHGEGSRRWDQEHDDHVLRRALDLIEPEFKPATWRAFRRLVTDGATPEEVAAELGLTVNAVFIAKSRVLRRLREEVRGLVDDASE